MCSIIGIINKHGKDITSLLLSMLEKTEHRGPDGAGICINGHVVREHSFSKLKKKSVSLGGSSGFGHLRLSITGEKGLQPFISEDKRFKLIFNGEIYNFKRLKHKLKHVNFETDSDGEVILKLIEKERGTLYERIRKIASQLDGDYLFAVTDGRNTYLLRDPLGIKQIYYVSNNQHYAFASEKKALEIMFEKDSAKRLKPGFMLEIGDHLNIYKINAMKKPVIRIMDKAKAFREYRKHLIDAVRKRVEGHKKIGVIFSGGIDSVLIAKIVKDLGKDVTCYTAGCLDSPDIKVAQSVAKVLGLKLKKSLLTKNKVKKSLKRIMLAIEDTNILQVEVAIPIFFSVDLAKKDGVRVLLTGQGADEIFAGYEWYPGILKDKGNQGLQDHLWNDITSLYKETLEREDKITMHHSTELRVPYLDPAVVKKSMEIHPRFKIKKKDDMRKLLHREVAESFGIPKSVCWRLKKGAQHGSGTHKLVESIAESSDIRAEETEKPGEEQLGSAYRYLGDYGKKEVQNFLDGIA